MAKKRIAIVTPTRDGLVDINYTNSVFHTQKHLGDEYDIELSLISGVSDIVGGRNKLFNKWYYETDVEYLLWIDSDISFSPLDLKKMLDYNVDCIGANYPKKKVDVKNLLQTASLMQQLYGKIDAQSCLEASFDYVVGGQTNIHEGGELDGLGTCEMLGMGLMLLSRSGADKLVSWCDENMTKKKWPWLDKMIEGYGVFDPTENEDNENLAEDFAFCKRLQQARVILYFHPKMKIRHTGMMAFDGDFSAVTELAKNAYASGLDMPGTNYKKREKQGEIEPSEFVD